MTVAAGSLRVAPSDSARDLVVCCDGTNNTLTGGIQDTNVLLLYSYLRKHADPATTMLYYDPGVGSPDSAPPTGLVDLLKRRWSRIAGLASGRGVYENIAEAYAFLMREWRPGDRIFCFGFSRGAFTARACVGMAAASGIRISISTACPAPRRTEACASSLRSTISPRGWAGCPMGDCWSSP